MDIKKLPFIQVKLCELWDKHNWFLPSDRESCPKNIHQSTFPSVSSLCSEQYTAGVLMTPIPRKHLLIQKSSVKALKAQEFRGGSWKGI